MAHSVPEVVRGEELPSVAPAIYPDRDQRSQLAFYHEPLHGAERRIVAVVLADHQDTLRSLRGLDQVEGIFDAGGQRLLAQDVFAGLERGLRHRMVRGRWRCYQHRVALDACQRLLQDREGGGSVRGAEHRTVGVHNSGQLDAGGAGHHSLPAKAPDTEPGLDYADDAGSSSQDAPASPFSSQAISSGVSSIPDASTLALNSSPVLQPTSAKTSSG